MEICKNRDKFISIVDDFMFQRGSNSSICWQEFDILVSELDKYWYFNLFPKDCRFNLVMDETSRMFNARNFLHNFSGENKWFLDFMFELRKYKVLFYLIVQDLSILDVNFSRLALQFRAFYKGFWFWRWYKDLEFPNPEVKDLSTAETVWWWPIFGAMINLHPLIKYPLYDYETEEPIFDSFSIYEKWSIYKHIKNWNPPKSRLYSFLNTFLSWYLDTFVSYIEKSFPKFTTLLRKF